jgi:hypothetical protein
MFIERDWIAVPGIKFWQTRPENRGLLPFFADWAAF